MSLVFSWSFNNCRFISLFLEPFVNGAVYLNQSIQSAFDKHPLTASEKYLLCFSLLKSELHSGDGQLVGEETHISGQLQGGDVGSRAVPPTNAAQQLSLMKQATTQQ